MQRTPLKPRITKPSAIVLEQAEVDLHERLTNLLLLDIDIKSIEELRIVSQDLKTTYNNLSDNIIQQVAILRSVGAPEEASSLVDLLNSKKCLYKEKLISVHDKRVSLDEDDVSSLNFSIDLPDEQLSAQSKVASYLNDNFSDRESVNMTDTRSLIMPHDAASPTPRDAAAP